MMNDNLSTFEAVAQFKSTAAACGLIIPDDMAVGVMARCDTTGKHGKNDGSYILHLDGIPAGGFENHQNGQGWQPWRADIGRPFTPGEYAQIKCKESADRAKREKQKREEQNAAAALAAEIWERADELAPGETTPYLSKKGVAPVGGVKTITARAAMECGAKCCYGLEGLLLIVPLKNWNGNITSLQFIAGDGQKRFLKNGQTAGSFFAIDGDMSRGAVLFCEGYATGASLHMATALPVFIAGNAGNLLPVATHAHRQAPGVLSVICADDDDRKPGNVGVKSATATANTVGGVIAIPAFGEGRNGETDFNDLHALRGLDEVARQIFAAIDGGRHD